MGWPGLVGLNGVITGDTMMINGNEWYSCLASVKYILKIWAKFPLCNQNSKYVLRET